MGWDDERSDPMGDVSAALAYWERLYGGRERVVALGGRPWGRATAMHVSVGLAALWGWPWRVAS